MSRTERRISPRKICTVAIRFNFGSNEHTRETIEERASETVRAQSSEHIGKALNLSERGIYFTCREKLSVGQPLDLNFTLPTELTGRVPENVRCRARVVHVDESGQDGLRGIGACVEHFEPTAAFRDWTN